jgi:hypothetical protein
VLKGWESGSGTGWGCPARQHRHQLHVTLEILSWGEKCGQPAWGEHHSRQQPCESRAPQPETWNGRGGHRSSRHERGGDLSRCSHWQYSPNATAALNPSEATSSLEMVNCSKHANSELLVVGAAYGLLPGSAACTGWRELRGDFGRHQPLNGLPMAVPHNLGDLRISTITIKGLFTFRCSHRNWTQLCHNWLKLARSWGGTPTKTGAGCCQNASCSQGSAQSWRSSWRPDADRISSFRRPRHGHSRFQGDNNLSPHAQTPSPNEFSLADIECE